MANPYYFYYGKYFRPYLKKEPQKTYSVAVMSLFTVMLFGVFAIAPTLKSIFKVQKELEKLTDLCAKLSTKIESIGEARIAYQEATPYREALASQIYPYGGWGKEVEAIQNLANTNKVKILDLRPGLILDRRGFLKIGLAGEYKQVKLFLEALQSRHLNYSLEKLELESSEASTGAKGKDSGPRLAEGEVKANLSLRVLFAPN